MNTYKWCVFMLTYICRLINMHCTRVCTEMCLHRDIKTRFPRVALHKKMSILPSLPPPLLTELCVGPEKHVRI